MTSEQILPSPSSNDDDGQDIQDRIVLRLAQTEEEVRAAQRLRYIVFYEEFGAHPPAAVAAAKRDFDEYDQYADHLIIIDEDRKPEDGQIVGTYRLFRRDKLPADKEFYTSHEFDISPLVESGAKLLELGRSCVLPEYRTKYILQRLWAGIADYLATHQIDLMFGCASLQGVSPEAVAGQLAYLHYFHAPPENLCPKAIKDCTAGLHLPAKEDVNAKRIFASLPPLIKGYLRVGAYIGQGAYLDSDFNCIDVCIVMPTSQVKAKYLKHYERQIQKEIVSDSEFNQNFSK
ncbi:MAG TPA: GNAT family N-acyltransferase [Alphaproteobacteria bacterium]|nr:GNAT family N-acyltransferase [Alphaproteobacteria bacterium]HNS44629.1 GNAT family N-acyltransferase [Alphaproteobacteria bacterium]